MMIRSERIVLGLFATVVGAIVACSDGPSPTELPATPEDLIITGSLYQAAWAPGDNGRLELVGMSSARVRSTRSGPLTVASQSESFDTSRANRLAVHLSSGAAGIARGVRNSSVTPNRVRGHGVTRKLANGSVMDVISVPDPDRRSGKPPRAIITRVDGRPASMIEISYTKTRGKWRPAQSRVSLFDSTGRLLVMTDGDASSFEYAASGRKSSTRGGLGSSIATAVRPDALYAEEVPSGCWRLFNEMNAANAAAAIAYAVWRAADVIAIAAFLVHVEADVEALTGNPASIAKAAAALLAWERAEAAAALARNSFYLATAIGVSKAAEFSECLLWGKKGDGGGGGDGCNGGEEKYCDYSIWQDGAGTWHIDESNCGCEPIFQL